jgi:glycosyltransferase involved in cell wall biosynthesis
MPSFRSPEVVERAIRSFQAQTYGPKELVVVVAYSNHNATRGLDRCHNYETYRKEGVIYGEGVAIHYVPPGLSIGELRNVACRVARGSVLAHWDDDDVSHPERLARSVEALDPRGVSIVGSSKVIFEEPAAGRSWRFDGAKLDPPYLVGGTLAYKRAAWERRPFEDVATGEDSRWYWDNYHNGVGIHDLADEALYTATISGDNTSKKDTSSTGWEELCGSAS